MEDGAFVNGLEREACIKGLNEVSNGLKHGMVLGAIKLGRMNGRVVYEKLGLHLCPDGFA